TSVDDDRFTSEIRQFYCLALQRLHFKVRCSLPHFQSCILLTGFTTGRTKKFIERPPKHTRNQCNDDIFFHRSTSLLSFSPIFPYANRMRSIPPAASRTPNHGCMV